MLKVQILLDHNLKNNRNSNAMTGNRRTIWHPRTFCTPQNQCVYASQSTKQLLFISQPFSILRLNERFFSWFSLRNVEIACSRNCVIELESSCLPDFDNRSGNEDRRADRQRAKKMVRLRFDEKQSRPCLEMSIKQAPDSLSVVNGTIFGLFNVLCIWFTFSVHH